MKERILLMDANDFTSSYNSQLLAHLEDCVDINQGDKLNFSTRTYFAGEEDIPVIKAFNHYLKFLSRDVDRIIINL